MLAKNISLTGADTPPLDRITRTHPDPEIMFC